MPALAAALVALLLAVPEPVPDWSDVDFGIPELSDLSRFPPRAVIGPNLGLAREVVDGLKARADVQPAVDFTEALTRARWVYRCWDRLDDVRTPGWNDYDHRLFLERLREQLGPYRYAAGTMPSPLAGFRPID